MFRATKIYVKYNFRNFKFHFLVFSKIKSVYILHKKNWSFQKFPILMEKVIICVHPPKRYIYLVTVNLLTYSKATYDSIALIVTT